MKRCLPVASIALLFLAASLRAEPPPPDPIAQYVFPPELIMRYAGDIGLDEGQRGAVKEAVQKAQAKFLDSQWQLSEEGEKLVRLLQARPADEGAVLSQVDRVLNLEREVKRTQLSLLVRLKNLLTDSQERKLTELRKKTAG
ncbi:MAG TPA: periplasmic heavy metal sensor [Thermoanaerobaculia bacterium]|nr:periplasmic heavy metal sensor [Thermoanaerobaculia bacterium]